MKKLITKKLKRPLTVEKKKTVDTDKQENTAPGFGGIPMRDLKKNLGCGG